MAPGSLSALAPCLSPLLTIPRRPAVVPLIRALPDPLRPQYWAAQTVTTVGYGDISARTVAERIYAITAQIGGGFVFSVVIGQIGATITRIDPSKAAHRRVPDRKGLWPRPLHLTCRRPFC